MSHHTLARRLGFLPSAHDHHESDLGDRSRDGIRAVLWSLGILLVTTLLQAAVLAATGSVALLADLIHNLGDALTAVPIGIAFYLRSRRAERLAGAGVVVAILVSAAFVLAATIERFINPRPPKELVALAGAGLIGFIGNEIAAIIRTRAGRRLDSPALVADGQHARVDGIVSLGVVGSAVSAALGAHRLEIPSSAS
jgi:cation diffusion facilitator family transporter